MAAKDFSHPRVKQFVKQRSPDSNWKVEPLFLLVNVITKWSDVHECNHMPCPFVSTGIRQTMNVSII
jgi:hypothetical protein